MKWIQKVGLGVLIAASCAMGAVAQENFSALQSRWLEDAKQGEDVSAYQWERGYLLYPEGAATLLAQLSDYQLRIHISHDPVRFITIGTVENTLQQKEMLMITAYRNTKEGIKKEMDVVLPTDEPYEFGKEVAAEQEIGLRREEWVELANQHNPARHIKAMYTQDATYLSAGRLSLGWEEIIERYAYMESESYSVDLVKKYLYQLSADKVIEVGRYYTGNNTSGPGGIYFILWTKSASGKWDIELDFNY